MYSVGNGVVVHLPGLFDEAKKCEAKGKQAEQSSTVILDNSSTVNLQQVSQSGRRD